MNEQYERYLCSRKWSEKKESVKERSGSICERCRLQKSNHVHHLTYARLYNEELEDLQDICKECHEFTHAKSDFDPSILPPCGSQIVFTETLRDCLALRQCGYHAYRFTKNFPWWIIYTEVYDKTNKSVGLFTVKNKSYNSPCLLCFQTNNNSLKKMIKVAKFLSARTDSVKFVRGPMAYKSWHNLIEKRGTEIVKQYIKLYEKPYVGFCGQTEMELLVRNFLCR